VPTSVAWDEMWADAYAAIKEEADAEPVPIGDTRGVRSISEAVCNLEGAWDQNYW